MSIVIDKAREYIGTPWHHTGRVKGVGIDCVGLAVCVMRDMGVQVQDVVNYTLGPERDLMMENLLIYADTVPLENSMSGDLWVISTKGAFNHCGFYCKEDDTLIHAWNTVGKVVEMRLNKYWIDGVYAVLRLKEDLWQP